MHFEDTNLTCFVRDFWGGQVPDGIELPNGQERLQLHVPVERLQDHDGAPTSGRSPEALPRQRRQVLPRAGLHGSRTVEDIMPPRTPPTCKT